MRIAKRWVMVISLVVILNCILVGCSTDQLTHQSIATTVEGKGKIKKEPSLKEYKPGDKIEFTAQSAEGWLFYGWQGDLKGRDNPQSLVADKDTQVKAEFIPQEKSFSLETIVDGQGTVTVEPKREIYQAGEKVKITAKPAEDWLLYYWGGDVCGNEQTKTVKINQDMKAKADFISLDQEVTIADSDLKAAVQNKIGKQTITVRDIKNLTSLDVTNEGIKNLSGIKYFLNLEGLNLFINGLEKIDPLAKLARQNNLESLVLSNNSITDISPISDLTNLETLGLMKNNIKDISPLANLTNLKKLTLIGDIYNEAETSNITDENLDILTNLTKLELLYLSSNGLQNIKPLSKLTNLEILRLGYNKISNLEPLSELNNLKELGLDKNEINDITPLANLNNLKELSLNDNNISNVDSCSQLTQLTQLNLNYNNISDISSFSPLDNLKSLSLKSNNIEDISVLLELDNLQRVSLNNNPLNSEADSVINELESRGVDVSR